MFTWDWLVVIGTCDQEVRWLLWSNSAQHPSTPPDTTITGSGLATRNLSTVATHHIILSWLALPRSISRMSLKIASKFLLAASDTQSGRNQATANIGTWELKNSPASTSAVEISYAGKTKWNLQVQWGKWGEGGGEGCRMLSDGDSDSDGIPPMIEIPP